MSQRTLIGKYRRTSILSSALHFWDSDNVIIDGDFITATDIGSVGGLDLTNPTLANKPTYSASSANFNGKPSLTFDGTNDYLYRSTSGFRESDQSGVFINVFRYLAISNVAYFSVGKDGDNLDNLILRANFTITLTSPSANLISHSIGITTIPYVVTQYSTGNAYKTYLNSTLITPTTVTIGADNGNWLGDFTGSNNISIGARIAGVNSYANMEWVMSGYYPYSDEATIESIIDNLKIKYGI